VTASIGPRCPDCGAPGVASLDACGELFAEVGAREFADEAFFRTHRLTVDAYCLQHPDAYMKSSKSAAAHLAAMCWSMEIGGSENLPRALKGWVDGPRTYARVVPPPPLHRGALTVRHVLGVEDPDEYAVRAEEWARSAWEAWGEHHDQARAWVAEALAERGRTRRWCARRA
jgi:hypothetical protein